MRDSMKITVGYQLGYMLLMQLAASGVAFVFGTVAFWYFTNINIAKQILSCILILVNFGMLYIPAKKFALLDGKSYTPLRQVKIKGLMLGCAITVCNLIFAVLFRVLWIYFGTETGITGLLPTLYNAFFYFWTFPYNGLMNLDNGVFTIYSAAIMLIMPPAATFIGYIAGCKKFELAEKLDKFMYEKE